MTLTSTDQFAHAVAVMNDLPSVDWDDLEAAAEITREVAHRIGDDRTLLRDLVSRAAVLPELREKCEIHTLDDKIVIWDDQAKGLRIRLRLANTKQYERVHNHRFSFTAYLLNGTYYHTLYATDQPLDETADVTRFWPRSVREERTGDIITLHHEQLHTTLTDPDTVSLMIQSPAQKRRAFMIRRSDGEVWWRVGAADEDEERRREVRMSDERLEHWQRRLAELGVC
jgi:predicted metal-dependent enzyme (double-stranded beta helix superfamily)